MHGAKGGEGPQAPRLHAWQSDAFLCGLPVRLVHRARGSLVGDPGTLRQLLRRRVRVVSIGAACPDGCAFPNPECAACAEVAVARTKRKKELGHLASKRLDAVAQELVVCASSWEPDARLVGNIRAQDIALLAVDYLCLIAERRK